MQWTRIQQQERLTASANSLSHPLPPTTAYPRRPPLLPPSLLLIRTKQLASCSLELLAEHEELGLIVDGEHTRTGHTTEDVGTRTLEERSDTFLGDDLSSGVHG